MDVEKYNSLFSKKEIKEVAEPLLTELNLKDILESLSFNPELYELEPSALLDFEQFSLSSPSAHLVDSGKGSNAGTVKPRKKLKPLERETNEALLLIYEIFNYYKVEYLDELRAHPAWGKIISKEFSSDLISNIATSNKYIILSGGEKLIKTDFSNKYRRRFE